PLIWYTVVATVIAAQLAISPAGADEFRLPKDLALRAGSIIALAITLIALTLGRLDFRRFGRKSLWWTVAIVSWAVITTVLSTNIRVSLGALMTVACASLLAALAFTFAAERSLAVLTTIFIPATLNAVLTIVQWLVPGVSKLTAGSVTAFLGNTDYIGTYLVVPSILALGTIVVTRRWPAALIFAVMTAGLIASQCVSALIA